MRDDRWSGTTRSAPHSHVAIPLTDFHRMSTDSESTGVKRRDFLKVLGVAGAATATIGCGSDRVEKLIPYVNHPDETVPGVSTYYATTCRECAAA